MFLIALDSYAIGLLVNGFQVFCNDMKIFVIIVWDEVRRVWLEVVLRRLCGLR